MNRKRGQGAYLAIAFTSPFLPGTCDRTIIHSRYKQQKYNLLREESEGYSKLITELASGTADEDDDAATEAKAVLVLTHVQSLIGKPFSTFRDVFN